jgi:hypothetical protein
MPRFVILEHVNAPDDPLGRHYDLLLEQGPACRTWRLAALPVCGGAAVAAVEAPPHRLAWLDHDAGAVSGGRGFARRIDGGAYEPELSPAGATSRATTIEATLAGGQFRGRLVLRAHEDRWLVRLDPQSPGAALREG